MTTDFVPLYRIERCLESKKDRSSTICEIQASVSLQVVNQGIALRR